MSSLQDNESFLYTPKAYKKAGRVYPPGRKTNMRSKGGFRVALNINKRITHRQPSSEAGASPQNTQRPPGVSKDLILDTGGRGS